MTRNALALTVVLSLFLASPPASAQDDEPERRTPVDSVINSFIQFDFSTPGARSLGLGGAFIGLADDATAAFTNPAGLTVLSQPEISLEGRSWTYTHEVPYRGHTFGPPSERGVDTVSGIVSRDFENDVSALSFASFVYPRGRWSLAAYRHVLSDFEANLESQGLFVHALFPGLEEFGELGGRFAPLRGSLNLEIVNYGLSGAFRVSENFSIGVGASYYEFEIDSTTQRFGLSNPVREAPGGFFGPADFSAANLSNTAAQAGDDNDVAAIAGLLWNINPRWSLGAVYRQGPSFEFESRISLPDGFEFPPQPAEFNVPDVYGVGIAYRPTDALVITLDYDLVEYSDLVGQPGSGFGETTPDQQAALQRLEIEDADEIHLGLEYVWAQLRYPVALRLGSYYDPAHKIHFEGSPDNSPAQRGFATQFRSGDDDYHYSVGLGVVFDQFQVDAAADFADLVETFSLSGVYRFGG